MDISIILILSIILLICSLISLIEEGTFSNKDFMKFIMIIVLISNVIIIFLIHINMSKPRAIDVYQGNTTLEIIYKNSIPIDSVVVWKDK